jgi:endoglucanase
MKTVIALQEFIDGEVLSLQSYKEFADNFICTLIPESSSPHITYTPGGMLYKPGGSNMQHVTSISFLLLTYAKYLSKSSKTVNCGDISVGPVTLQRQAKKQVG